MLVMASRTNCVSSSLYCKVFFFLLPYLCIASVGVNKIQKEAKEREFERGEMEVRVSDWDYSVEDFGFAFFLFFFDKRVYVFIKTFDERKTTKIGI